jgi:hypothetical protein
MRGELVVDKVNPVTGEVVRVAETHNLFLNQGYTHLAKLLAGDDAANQQVAKMQFGTGTDSPLVTDTLLQTPITPIKDIASRTYPTDDTAQLVVYLLVGEANGFPISEAGLVAANGELIARAVFAPHLKTSDYQFKFTWTLTALP